MARQACFLAQSPRRPLATAEREAAVAIGAESRLRRAARRSAARAGVGVPVETARAASSCSPAARCTSAVSGELAARLEAAARRRRRRAVARRRRRRSRSRHRRRRISQRSRRRCSSARRAICTDRRAAAPARQPRLRAVVQPPGIACRPCTRARRGRRTDRCTSASSRRVSRDRRRRWRCGVQMPVARIEANCVRVRSALGRCCIRRQA